MQSNFIQKLTDIVINNLERETFGPEDLAREAGMSHSNLNRKLKSISNQNASQFIREIRLKKAKELLLNEDLTVAEISYLTGFGSPSYFNTCFHANFGISPGEFRNQGLENEPDANPVIINLKKSKRTHILLYSISGLMVLISISYFIFNKISLKEIQKEKSIAVLTFKYLGDEADKQYMADAMMDAILVHLSEIKDLRVISRTSVEQYRKKDKTSKAIGRELNVEYVLEGSFLMDGEKGRLILQLIRTSDESHVWSKIIDHDWKDVFSIQSEVAEDVANIMQAVITPHEQKLIQKTPTSNLTAYDYYIQGKGDLEKYEFTYKQGKSELEQYEYTCKGGLTELNNARYLFQKALELDSTFSLAYIGLARVQFNSTARKMYLSEKYMDTVLMYADKALTYDPKCAQAYYYRALAYSESSKTKEALKEIDKALTYNPNDSRSYFMKANIYEFLQDHLGGISNMYEGVIRDRGIGLPQYLRSFSHRLANTGYTDLGREYIQQAFELDRDSLQYFSSLAYMEFCDRQLEKAYQLSKIVHLKDSTFESGIEVYSMMTGRYEETISEAYREMKEIRKLSGSPHYIKWKNLAYYNWRKGKMKEAKYYIEQLIKISKESINVGRLNALQKGSHFDLAEMYAFIGDKEKAYYYLDEVNKNRAFAMWWVILFEREPYFDNMRQEPRFQKILKDVEAKYQAEHVLVGKWLKGKGLI
jgi:TolB-like protein/AraC-like DNA-binding protein/tetratricopeptide (TPR) repeat protein